jgi:serine/threonine-protein kinase
MPERDPFSLIGKTLAGHFLVERLAGEGRFSIVYRGEHIGPKEPVALKCLKLGLELDGTGAETFLKRFREENKTNSRVSKGNSLFVRSIGSGMTTSDAGQHVPYTVLEWLEGRSLAAELATRREQGATGRPLSEVLALLGPAISAIGHAHDSEVPGL